jgi:hypothetical protein
MSDLHELAPEKDRSSNGAARIVDLQVWRELRIPATPKWLQETSASESGDTGRAAQVDQGQEVTKSYFLVELEHTKALPEDLSDMAGQRIYNLLYSRGCEAGVRVKPIEQLMDKPEWEQE